MLGIISLNPKPADLDGGNAELILSAFQDFVKDDFLCASAGHPPYRSISFDGFDYVVSGKNIQDVVCTQRDESVHHVTDSTGDDAYVRNLATHFQRDRGEYTSGLTRFVTSNADAGDSTYVHNCKGTTCITLNFKQISMWYWYFKGNTYLVYDTCSDVYVSPLMARLSRFNLGGRMYFGSTIPVLRSSRPGLLILNLRFLRSKHAKWRGTFRNELLVVSSMSHYLEKRNNLF